MSGGQPLPAQMYHILLALGDGTMHGYGIIQAFESLTGGEETLLPGSLYAALARMESDGLVEVAAAPAGEASGGPSRRYYRMTLRGRSAARAESERRERLLELARSRGLATPRGA